MATSQIIDELERLKRSLPTDSVLGRGVNKDLFGKKDEIIENTVKFNDGIEKFDGTYLPAELETDTIRKLREEIKRITEQIGYTEQEKEVNQAYIKQQEATLQYLQKNINLLNIRLSNAVDEREREEIKKRFDNEKARIDEIIKDINELNSRLNNNNNIELLQAEKDKKEIELKTNIEVAIKLNQQNYQKAYEKRLGQLDNLNAKLGFLNAADKIDNFIEEYKSGSLSEGELYEKLLKFKEKISEPNINAMLGNIHKLQTSLDQDYIADLEDESARLYKQLMDFDSYIIEDDEYANLIAINNVNNKGLPTEEYNDKLNDINSKLEKKRRLLLINNDKCLKAKTRVDFFTMQANINNDKKYIEIANGIIDDESVNYDKSKKLVEKYSKEISKLQRDRIDLIKKQGRFNVNKYNKDHDEWVKINNELTYSESIKYVNSVGIMKTVDSLLVLTEPEEKVTKQVHLNAHVKKDKDDEKVENISSFNDEEKAKKHIHVNAHVKKDKDDEEVENIPVLSEEDRNIEDIPEEIEEELDFPEISEEDRKIVDFELANEENNNEEIALPNELESVEKPSDKLIGKIKNIFSKSKIWIATLLAATTIITASSVSKNNDEKEPELNQTPAITATTEKDDSVDNKIIIDDTKKETTSYVSQDAKKEEKEESKDTTNTVADNSKTESGINLGVNDYISNGNTTIDYNGNIWNENNQNVGSTSVTQNGNYNNIGTDITTQNTPSSGTSQDNSGINWDWDSFNDSFGLGK